jgi:hypothetical protein
LEYTGRTAEWPAGLSFDVKTSDGVSHPDWLSTMAIQPYLPRPNRIVDSTWRADGQPVPAEYTHEVYDFVFTIPEASAGQGLIISARFHHPVLGDLLSPRPATMNVVPVTSPEDQERVQTSWLFYTYWTGNYARTLTIADSLISAGYGGLMGLDAAQRAARRLGNYSAALRYMDLSMSVNGSFETEKDWTEGGRYPAKVQLSKEEQQRVNYAQHQKRYLMRREQYLQKIAEQQQQQR